MLSKHWDKRSRLSWLTHLLSLWLIFCKTLPLPIVPKWCSSGLARVMLLLLPHTLVLGDLVCSLSLLLILPLRFAKPPFSQLKPFLQPLMPIGHLCSDVSPISQTTPPTLLPLSGRGINTYPTHAHANQAHASPHLQARKLGFREAETLGSGHAQLVRG